MPENKKPPRNDQTLKSEKEEEKISRLGELKECQRAGCKKIALSLSQYCSIHTEDKEEYKGKIEEWAKAGKSMDRFILEGVDLSKADLFGAKLSGAMIQRSNLLEADLNAADMSESWLGGTNLSGAFLELANLSRAKLSGANLSKAILWKANLSGAHLQNANLSGASFVEADLSNSLLSEADLSEADLTGANLYGALFVKSDLINTYLNWAKLTGAIALTKENFSEEITKQEKKDAEHYKVSYITVKNFFSQSGQYDDASWAAFRERTLERIALAHEIWKKGLKGLLSWAWWKSSFRWSGSKIISLLNGYGERPLRVIISSGAIVIFFSIIYFIFKWIQSYPMEELYWWDYLYFSIVTFTTLGYGDIRPLAVPWARLVASGEAFMGAFMIALFVWTLARKYVAR